MYVANLRTSAEDGGRVRVRVRVRVNIRVKIRDEDTVKDSARVTCEGSPNWDTIGWVGSQIGSSVAMSWARARVR